MAHIPLKSRMVSAMALALIVLVAAISVEVLQVRAGGPLELNGDSVIRYEERQPLLDSSRSIVDGVREADGSCTFTSPLLTATEPGEVVQLNELAYDPETCRSLVAIGHPSAPVSDVPQERDGYEYYESERIGPGAPASVASAAAPAGILSNGDQSAFTTTSHYGWHKSWFEDPLDIDVNSATNKVWWDTGGSCTSNRSGGSSVYWLAASGWGLQSRTINVNWECEFVHSTSYVHFKNGIFCAFTDTNTYNQNNHAFGWNDGSVTGYVIWSKTGWCSFMLSHHTQLKLEY